MSPYIRLVLGTGVLCLQVAHLNLRPAKPQYVGVRKYLRTRALP